MYRSSPFRSTLNTGYITCLGMCKVCTEAVHSVALCPAKTAQTPKHGPGKKDRNRARGVFQGRRTSRSAGIHIYFSSGGLLIPGALNDIHWIEKYGWHIACDWHQPYFLLQLIFGVSGVKPNRIFQKWWSRSHKNDRMMMFWALPKHWFTVDPMKV